MILNTKSPYTLCYQYHINKDNFLVVYTMYDHRKRKAYRIGTKIMDEDKIENILSYSALKLELLKIGLEIETIDSLGKLLFRK